MSERRPFIAGNGTDETMLLRFCEGCRHFGESGSGCRIWMALDMKEPQTSLTVANIFNDDIRCSAREETDRER